jgi:hypothetical protein
VILPGAASDRTFAGDDLVNAAAVRIHDLSGGRVRALIEIVDDAIAVVVGRDNDLFDWPGGGEWIAGGAVGDLDGGHGTVGSRDSENLGNDNRSCFDDEDVARLSVREIRVLVLECPDEIVAIDDAQVKPGCPPDRVVGGESIGTALIMKEGGDAAGRAVKCVGEHALLRVADAVDVLKNKDKSERVSIGRCIERDGEIFGQRDGQVHSVSAREDERGGAGKVKTEEEEEKSPRFHITDRKLLFLGSAGEDVIMHGEQTQLDFKLVVLWFHRRTFANRWCLTSPLATVQELPTVKSHEMRHPFGEVESRRAVSFGASLGRR